MELPKLKDLEARIKHARQVMRATRCMRMQSLTRNALDIIKIENGTFFRHHPSSPVVPNPPLFPGLSFSLRNDDSDRPTFDKPQYWAIIGPSSSGKTTFLELLRGLHFCDPVAARSFPHLSSLGLERTKFRRMEYELRNPLRAIQYVGFEASDKGFGGSSTRGAYLSARYESRREASDFSLLEYLEGKTSLNADSPDLGDVIQRKHEQVLSRAIDTLRLRELLPLSVRGLSNGQGRRARIAKAVASGPKVVLLDEPFRMLICS